MLGVAMHITIKTLAEKGYSKKKIAEIVGCSRKTVRRALARVERGEELKRKKVLSIISPYEGDSSSQSWPGAFGCQDISRSSERDALQWFLRDLSKSMKLCFIKRR